MQNLNIDNIFCGYSEVLMQSIRQGSIALSFWSPPYFLGKDYECDETYESWQRMLKNVISAHFNVLKPGGFMVINIADILSFKDVSMPRIMGLNPSNRKCAVTVEMVQEAVKKYPEYNRNKLAALLGCSEQTIDRRLHGNNIRGGKHAINTKVKLVGGNLEKYAEDCGLYLYDVRLWKKDPAWANSKWTSNTLKAVSEFEYLFVFWKPGEYTVNRDRLSPSEWKEWGYRAIWELSSVRKNDIHPAMFPVSLAERVIRLYTDEGDIVLDPFMGSGTTAIAAIKNHRHYIGIDKSEQYCKVAKERIACESYFI